MKRRILSLAFALSILFSSFSATIVFATQSMSENFSSDYDLTGDGATDIVSVALAQVGKTKSQLGYTEAWCADFVSDCAKLANEGEAIPFYGGVSGLYTNVVNAGGVAVSSPQCGDLVFYDKSNNPYCHVGIMIDDTYMVNGNIKYRGESVTKVYKIKYTAYNDYTAVRFLRPNYQNNSGTSLPTSPYNKIDIPTGVYVIHSAHDDNYVLDISGDSMEVGANIQLYDYLHRNDIQKFRIISHGDYYTIQSTYSGYWLDIARPIGNNSNVKLHDEDYWDDEKWIFEDAGNGYVCIKSLTGYYLDLQGSVAKNNANIQVYSFVDNNDQKWRLEECSNVAPQYSVLRTDQTSYEVDETVTFSCQSDGIVHDLFIYCPNGETLVYEKVGREYELGFGMSGHYQALLQTWNGVGNLCSELIDFYIEEPSVTGDVNSDGIISSFDLKLLESYVSTEADQSEINFENSDLNGDGIITSADIKLLKTYLSAGQ